MLVHGLFADALFKGHLYPTKSIPLGFEEVPVPVMESIEDVPSLVGWLAGHSREPPYTPDEYDVERILSDNVTSDDGGVVHHGVRYRSAEEAATVGGYYPLTNDGDYNHYAAAIQTCPHRTPFLDSRVLDLHLRYPIRYQLRRNIVHDAVERLNEQLAKIPHGSSHVPLAAPFWIELPVRYATLFWRKYVAETPEPRLSRGPWVDHDGLIRSHDFVGDHIAAGTAELASIECVDLERVEECYSAHRRGEQNNWRDLYALTTLLNGTLTRER